MTIKQLISCGLALVLATFAPGLLPAQYLISAESLGTRSKAQLQAQIGQEPRSAIELFKIRYMTVDTDGATDTASGLLVYPDDPLSSTLPLVIYQHGTTNGPSDCPSRLAAGSSEAFAYGGMGYVTIAPDYLGLGDNDNFHPYVHAASEASAGLDMLFAAVEWLDISTGEPWIGELFISGYSQGGHAAAALQRELEENWSLVYPVTASTPMSGPYSISGVMYNRIISDEIYFTPAYIAYVALAYQEVYGTLYNDLSEMFKTPYLPPIQQFRNEQITLFEMNSALIVSLFSNAGAVRPKAMFVDSVLAALIADENHPLRVALRDNDVYDWAPQAPTRLYYCTQDEQVPYQNALFADSVMQENGAADLMAVNFGALNHSGCATPAIRTSIEFFDSFILPSSVHDRRSVEHTAFTFPNPAARTIAIDPDLAVQVEQIEILDLHGRIAYLGRVIDQGRIDVASLPNGQYLIRAYTSESVLQQTVVIQH